MAALPTDRALSHADRRQRWRAHVDAQAAGPLSQRRYCERHGLAYSSFTYWRRRLRPGPRPRASVLPPRAPSPTASSSAFVPVSVLPGVSVSAKLASSAISPSAAPLTVVLPGGLRIEGIEAANLETVAALVAAL